MKSVKVLEIIAEELKMPYDSTLDEILAALWIMDRDGEIMKLLVKAGTEDLLDKFRSEGLIA